MKKCDCMETPPSLDSSFIFSEALDSARGGLMVSALDSGASSPGSSPDRGHCVAFLGKTLHSHGASPPRCSAFPKF